MKLRCAKCHRPMKGTTAYDGACACGGLIEVGESVPHWFHYQQRETIEYATMLELLETSSSLTLHQTAWLERWRMISVKIMEAEEQVMRYNHVHESCTEVRLQDRRNDVPQRYHR